MDKAVNGPASLNVLVIDDDVLIQKMVKKALEIMGARKIDIVADGQAALQSVKSKDQAGQSYHLIICDWDMPVMDGIQFLETFRKTNKKAIVAMVTARTSAIDFSSAKNKGADYFFMKPLEMDMLKIRLDAALNEAVSRSTE